jgi:hypothetical protein
MKRFFIILCLFYGMLSYSQSEMKIDSMEVVHPKTLKVIKVVNSEEDLHRSLRGLGYKYNIDHFYARIYTKEKVYLIKITKKRRPRGFDII